MLSVCVAEAMTLSHLFSGLVIKVSKTCQPSRPPPTYRLEVAKFMHLLYISCNRTIGYMELYHFNIAWVIITGVSNGVWNNLPVIRHLNTHGVLKKANRWGSVLHWAWPV